MNLNRMAMSENQRIHLECDEMNANMGTQMPHSPIANPGDLTQSNNIGTTTTTATINGGSYPPLPSSTTPVSSSGLLQTHLQQVMSKEEVLKRLGDDKQLERERALIALEKQVLPSLTKDEICDGLIPYFVQQGGDDSLTWQVRCGALLGLFTVVKYTSARHVYGKVEDTSRQVTNEERIERLEVVMVETGINAVGRSELRERQAGAQLLGELSKRNIINVWKQCGDKLLDSIDVSFALDAEQRSFESEKAVKEQSGLSKAGTQLLHDTEGWRNLTTSLGAVKSILEASGPTLIFEENVKNRLLPLALRAREHTNRFVREVSLFVLTALIASADKYDRSSSVGVSEADSLLLFFADQVVVSTAIGLDDNWSQVRFAACVCVRELMTRVDEQHRSKFYPLLVPRMCLNRHYVAEGVRLYSQTTWKLVMGDQGRNVLQVIIDNVVQYYIAQTEAENHAVREASCYALSELAMKLPDENRVVPHLHAMLVALVNCFKDESWPVRDCACTASSQIVSRFCALNSPGLAVCEPAIPEFYLLWVAHLADNIPSVRANSARSLAMVAAVFPPDYVHCGIERIVEDCRKYLRSVHNQPRDSVRYAQTDDTHFGAAHKIARDHDPALHENQPMYSCGSLAAKSGVGTGSQSPGGGSGTRSPSYISQKFRRGGGCMDHGFSRTTQPWEETDGALRLWGALSSIGAVSPNHEANVGMPNGARQQDAAPATATGDIFAHANHVHDSGYYCSLLLPDVVDVANMNVEFAHAPNLLETLWRELATVTSALPKASVIEYLPKILPALLASEKCGNKLTEASAKSASMNLRVKVGFNEWKAALSKVESSKP